MGIKHRSQCMLHNPTAPPHHYYCRNMVNTISSQPPQGSGKAYVGSNGRPIATQLTCMPRHRIRPSSSGYEARVRNTGVVSCMNAWESELRVARTLLLIGPPCAWPHLFITPQHPFARTGLHLGRCVSRDAAMEAQRTEPNVYD